jgi:hypothetical protein
MWLLHSFFQQVSATVPSVAVTATLLYRCLIFFSFNVNNYQETILYLSGPPESGITSKIVIYAGIA